ncbi:hypothetical protein GCM10027270_13720 [Nocardioides ginkgobilobae]
MAVLGQQHPLDHVVETLSGALDQARAASLIGLDRAATAQVLRELDAMASRLAELTATVLRHGAEVQVEESDGSTSTAIWWAHHTHTTRAAAHRQMALAEALGRYDLLRDALATGQANTEQAGVVVRALDDLPDDLDPDLARRAEQHLVGLCADFDAKALRVLGRHVLAVIAPEIGEAHEARLLEAEERRAHERTRLTTTRDGQGLVHGRFTIPELHGAMLDKALQALTWADHDPARRDLTTPQQAGYAFCDLLERVSDKDVPTVGGTGATVVVTMTLETLQGGLASASLDNGDRLSAATARRLACEAGIIPLVLGGHSEVLDLGRRRRYHSRAQRIAIAHRDQHCQWTGCDAPPSRCHVHHTTPWSHGGPTTTDQGRLYCSRHHHRIHQQLERTQRLRE